MRNLSLKSILMKFPGGAVMVLKQVMSGRYSWGYMGEQNSIPEESPWVKFLQNSSNCSGLYLGLLAAVVEALSTEGASLEKRLLSVHQTIQSIIKPGIFCPFSKNSRPPSKKTQANFWQKTQLYGGNFGCQEKNSIFFDKSHTAAFKLGGLFYILALFSISRVNL